MSNLSKKQLNEYQYLFLGGIVGEILSLPFVSNYLNENERILRQKGVEHIKTMTLNSLLSAETNARKLQKILEKQFSLNPKKIILFAHSKGALETILCFQKNLDLFEKTIHKVILVQPPFKGSELLGPKTGSLFKIVWPGLHCLKKNHYSETIESIFNHPQSDNHISFSKNSFLVIKGTKNKTSDVSWILKSPHSLYRLKNKESDGLVDLHSQSLSNEEYMTSVSLEIDHSDLFCSNKLSKLSDKKREELFLSICHWAIYSDSSSLQNWRPEPRFNQHSPTVSV
jgi:hypothetical protein